MSATIQPTIGRVVYYWPGDDDARSMNYVLDQPLAAIITNVYTDSVVNLMVMDATGNTFAMTAVTLVQPCGSKPIKGSYCEGMPYQAGQAASAAAQREKFESMIVELGDHINTLEQRIQELEGMLVP